MVPDIIVRTAGFAAAELDGLRLPDAAQAAARLVRIESQLSESLSAQGWDTQRLDKLWDRLRRGLRVRGGHAAIEDFLGTREKLAELAAAATIAAQEHLARFGEDARVREALAMTNPGLLRDLSNGRTSTRLRHQLASYLQRLCAKNETTSFFGPINYGTVDPDADPGVAVTWAGPKVLIGRRAHLAASVNDAVTRWVAFSEPVRPWLVLRRRSGLPTPKLTDLAARLLHRLDGRSTLRVHSQALATDLTATGQAAGELVEAGLATHQFQAPAASPDPLGLLWSRLMFTPAGDIAALTDYLRELMALRDGFCADDADGKSSRQKAVSALVQGLGQGLGQGTPGRVAAGQFYQDRLPLREECAGTLRLTVTGDAARQLRQRLSPALEFLARLAIRRKVLAQQAIGRRLGERTVPLWRLAAALPNDAPDLDARLRGRLAAAIGPGTDPEVDLSTVDVSDLVPGREPYGVVCSADVMICAASLAGWRAGRYTPVLADVHDTALLTDWALQFHPDAARVRARMHEMCAPGWNGMPVVCVLAGRRTGIPPLEPPAIIAELGGLPEQPNVWQVDLADLTVVSDGQRARLFSPQLGSEVQLYNGELNTLAQTAFGAARVRPPGLRVGSHTPRLRYGATVIQRRSWTVPVSRLVGLASGPPEQLLVDAHRVWREFDLPTLVFVKLPGEAKPMLAAADSPLLLGALARIASRRDGTAIVSEMLPGPDQLWLSDADGQRYTAELRCVFVRRPSDE
ncbi:MAG TPA: lantibiotic dehydratase [Candidatus Limnocylindrales bacterium]|nr:lantibiotic dehydratase [Candidatus Limnocylindrales bacterium]